jgi:uncharacterized membrane protein
MLKSENERRFHWLTAVILAAIILLLELGYDNFGLDVRFLNDYYDRSDYAHIGARVLTGEIPYVDVATEYPQVPVYLFRSLTWLASRLIPEYWMAEAGFLILWTFFVGVITLLVTWQLWRMLPMGKRGYAWLMFLPGAIYFSFNRFDILPAYLCLLAALALDRKRFTCAAALLAIGTFTKWYPLLIFPFFLIYEWKTTRKLPWRPVVAFGGISLLILLPTFILGGWQAVWQPLGWHLGRLAESGTFSGLVDGYLGNSGLGSVQPGGLTPIFTSLGFSGLLLIFLSSLTTIKKVLLASITTLLIFIFFTRIFSPQWWLWILPFLILTIENKIDLILIVLYDLLSYAAFPFAYDLTGNRSTIFLLISGLLLILIVILVIRTIMKNKMEEGQASA